MKMTKRSMLCLLMALLLTLGMTACSAKEEQEFSADDMIGIWGDNVAGRATLDIRAAEETGKYDILVSWGNSAAQTYIWTMTAKATDNNVLSYEDCTHTIVTFSENNEESIEEVYINGHGTFTLLSTNEIQWDDNIENAAEDLLFVSE